MSKARPILVTGAHRSGTGWVGKMIAACPTTPVAYLWEPFSLLHRPGVCAAKFPYWYSYVCAENEGTYLDPVADMLRFRYRVGAELAACRSPRDLARLERDWARFGRYRRVNARPLLKDPIAVFSSEWLCDRYGADVIVLIRHPGAFANSLKTRGLAHPFDHFLRQPLLMRDMLAPYERQISRFAEEPQPLLDQAILLWKVIHSAILDLRSRRPDWLFMRLEDISREPQASFEKMYGKLGLTYDETARSAVASSSDPSNPAETADPAAVMRNSAASIAMWKLRLAPEEIDRVRAGVEPIASEFYADSDW